MLSIHFLRYIVGRNPPFLLLLSPPLHVYRLIFTTLDLRHGYSKLQYVSLSQEIDFNQLWSTLQCLLL